MPAVWLFRSQPLPVASKFGGMSVPDAKRLKALENENARLKKLLADAMLEQEVAREVRCRRRRAGD